MVFELCLRKWHMQACSSFFFFFFFAKRMKLQPLGPASPGFPLLAANSMCSRIAGKAL